MEEQVLVCKMHCKESGVGGGGALHLIISISGALPRSLAVIKKSSFKRISVHVSLNVISVVQAHCCTSSKQVWHRGLEPLSHSHTNISLLSLLFSHPVLLLRSLSGTVQLCQICPGLTDHRKEQHF